MSEWRAAWSLSRIFAKVTGDSILLVMLQKRLTALLILVIGAGVAWFVYSSEVGGARPFKLGLDLSGGTQLVYRADLSAITGADVADSMASLRDTIERRVNLFGVSEPIVQTEHAGTLAGTPEERLIVELPGVTDTEKAIALIGQTPVLEFRLLKGDTPPGEISSTTVNVLFHPAAITGKDLASAQLQFNQSVGGIPNEPVVVLKFNSEGARTFATLTRDNVGRYFGIFLDGVPISVPVIREAIPDGTAVISGGFTAEGAKELARNLNYGALPVPIELISTQTVSATLGEEAVQDGIQAVLWGVLAVALFMVLWYRLPGLLATSALLLYVIVVLALFLIIPVTLTAAGIAAFILSVGMAVDANILILDDNRRHSLLVRDVAHQRFCLSIRPRRPHLNVDRHHRIPHLPHGARPRRKARLHPFPLRFGDAHIICPAGQFRIAPV